MGNDEGLWRKLRAGLARTQERITERLGAALDLPASLEAETAEELEEALIAADLGVATTGLLIERLRERLRRSDVGRPERLREILADEIERLLTEGPAAPTPDAGGWPRVTLVVGVNGAGKTTSIAKLARREQLAGRRVVLAAADTFRAAAIEQLVLWGERLGVEVIRQAAGSDPAAVVHDAVHAARARRVDHLIVDTAGRLHNKEHLMAELAKIRRVIDREAAGWTVRTLLVLDATTGQNALAQARAFLTVAAVDGVLLSKLDGTAKGGMVVAVARELGLPVLHLGVGEKAEDLVDFDPREFAAALVR
ncbi:MAG: signal recognition particle-docking protein FtsY [Thermoanaerobaculia bacterium]|nr:MAG: signal recognition particle-docking protein FtsY [Thermoanaerobaculia bacterium]MBZ0103896.1 signal recognition particle-docking protein FtsY [Thermoanaerobaculia bacterium]